MNTLNSFAAAVLAPVAQAMAGEAASHTAARTGTVTATTVLVERGGIELNGETKGATSGQEFKVHIPQSDVAAISAPGDTLAFKRRLTDAAATTMKIATLIGESGGFWIVICKP